MKVLCIDASKMEGWGQIKEGEVYTARQSDKYDDCYQLRELPYALYGVFAHYYKWRFVPLSDIDETELIKERQEDFITA